VSHTLHYSLLITHNQEIGMQALTQHASVRMQQRGITPDTIEALLAYGAKEYDHRGATVVYFDKPARRRLLADVGEIQYKTFEGKLNTYAVLSNGGNLITVGHRAKRINRH
jgi:hypothetical protein